MLRNRLIFALIYGDGFFHQSRNFRLQRVGNINWLERNYKFQKISFSIDELVILDASKNKKDITNFAATVEKVVGDVFIPVAAGGGVRSVEDADKLFNSGADKVILNTVLNDNPEIVKDIAYKYGIQSLVACIDYKIVDGVPRVFVEDGTRELPLNIIQYIEYVQDIGIGEILLNSIGQDGTGFGYDLDTLSHINESIDVPLILMGGAGNEKHLDQALKTEKVSAVCTANLFNFIGNGLPNARQYMLKEGSNLAQWPDN